MKFFILRTSFALSIALPASAGVVSGGGGLAAVCRGPDHKIVSATLLDLYESASLGLTLPRPTGSVERDYFLAAANTYRLQGVPQLADEQQEMIASSLRKFFEIVEMKPGGTLLPTNDVGSAPVLPQGCQLEQLAVFHDELPNRVEVDSEIWSALDSLNRSALVTHEAHYYWLRKLHERTSEASRAFVAHVYAIGGNTPSLDGVPWLAKNCSSEDPRFRIITDRTDDSLSWSNDRPSGFYAFPINTPEGSGMKLQFTTLAGRPQVVKTTAIIAGVDFETRELWNQSIGSMVLYPRSSGINIVREVSLEGGLRPGYSIEVHYVSDEPIRILTKFKGEVMTDEFLTNCSARTN